MASSSVCPLIRRRTNTYSTDEIVHGKSSRQSFDVHPVRIRLGVKMARKGKSTRNWSSELPLSSFKLPTSDSQATSPTFHLVP